MDKKRLTVFTPTYNRANVLHRVYDSLVVQTYRDFLWIIVDDGSTDDTKSVVDAFCAENKMEIRYYRQKNQGKHIATNFAVSIADTELFVIADSDDAFVPEALEKLVAAWDSVPEEDKSQYKGVICRCFDSETGKPIGVFPKQMFDSNDVDGFFIHKLSFEKWMLFRTDVLREFPFPGKGQGLKFFPETVIWQSMGRKYKTRYIEDPLREYFRDQDNALTHTKRPRFRENVFLWEHHVNNNMDHFWDAPKLFAKAFVGLCRDNILVGKSFEQIIKIPNRWWKRAICIMAYPAGWVLSLKYQENAK